ncbi:MAG: hypothetical protein WC943_02475 [Elusimicrobiota bacterium]
MKTLSAILFLLWSRGLAHGQATSAYRVVVSSAQVTGLDCRGRKLAMEHTKGMSRSYKTMSANTFVRDPDPRYFAMGLASMVAMVPLTVLAVPADLLSAPFRRECSFEFSASGRLAGWAGRPAGGVEVILESHAAASSDAEEGRTAGFVVSRATTTTDAQGGFELSIPGRVGRGGAMGLQWLASGLPSGRMTLRKRFGSLILSEPESEFGASLETMEPLVIRPR